MANLSTSTVAFARAGIFFHRSVMPFFGLQVEEPAFSMGIEPESKATVQVCVLLKV